MNKDRIIEILIEKIDFLEDLAEMYESEIDAMVKNEIELTKELEKCKKPTRYDITTPDGAYKALPKVPFVDGNENYYISHNKYFDRYSIQYNVNFDDAIAGLEYITKERAEWFCKEFNR